MESPYSILIVEDEAVIALDLQLQLEDMGYRVLGPAESGPQALALAAQERPDLVLMDIRIQGPIDGIETAARLGRVSGLPVVFLTSHSDDETVAQAARTSPCGFLTKPFEGRALRAAIEMALSRAQLERRLRESERWFAATLRCVQDGVIVVNPDATLRFINPAAEALTGWSAEEAVGRRLAEVVRFAPGDTEPPAALQALAQNRHIGVQHGRRLLRRNSARAVVTVDESAALVEGEFGLRMGAVLVLRDATERLAREGLDAAGQRRPPAANTSSVPAMEHEALPLAQVT
ncbi:ATP-binding response regulator [Azohydromonas caseinilytica]|uniref:Response regulator n=1 Tax=Azohydromonas caseinilytica TaxID=2728836 RepID=A0A848F5K3_9BURK|nr:response regulator [Azohydromonas caseinilytica]NML13381.1 response regulator [Azohydromonas caseinilytica]